MLIVLSHSPRSSLLDTLFEPPHLTRNQFLMPSLFAPRVSFEEDLYDSFYERTFSYSPAASFFPVFALQYLSFMHQDTHSPYATYSFSSRSRVFDDVAEGSASDDYYTRATQANNSIRHDQALERNQDGADFFAEVVTDYQATLSSEKEKEFVAKIQESDPEIFVQLPRLAVEKAISSSTRLTHANTPQFLHSYLNLLEQLRRKQLNERAAKDAMDKIATELARDVNCTASLQRALAIYS